MIMVRQVKGPAAICSWYFYAVIAAFLIFEGTATLKVRTSHQAEAATASVVQGDDMLRWWLRSLVFRIPDIYFVQSGLNISLSDLTCSQFDIRTILTSQPPGKPLAVNIAAQGFSAQCNTTWSFKMLNLPYLKGSGGALATVGGDSFITGPLELVLDDDPVAPLPKTIKAENCKATLSITDLQFTGSSPLDWILKLLTSLIQSVIQSVAGPAICTGLDKAVGGFDFSSWMDLIREIANPGSPPQPVLPLAGGSDIPDWTENRLFNSFAKVVNEVIGNTSAQSNINDLMSKISNNGNFTLWSQAGFVKPISLKIPNLGECNLSVPGASIAGLTSFRSMSMGAGSDLGNDTTAMYGGMSMRNFNAAGWASLRCQPMPPMAEGPALTENLSFIVNLSDIGLHAVADIAIRSEYLFVGGVMSTPGKCLPGVLNASRIEALQVNATAQAITIYPRSGDSLEQDVDGLLNLAISILLTGIGQSLQVLTYGLMQSFVRDLVNVKLDKRVAPTPCLQGPPANQGVNLGIADMGAFMAILLGVPALVLLSPSARALQRLWGCGSRQRNVSVSAIPLPTGLEDNCEAPTADDAHGIAPQGHIHRIGLGPIDRGHGGDTGAESFHGSNGGIGRHCESNLAVNICRGRARLCAFCMGHPDWECLASHPKVGTNAAIGMPLLVGGIISMLICSNFMIGAEVWMMATIQGQEFILHNVFDFSLTNSVSEMWQAGSFVLAVIIAFFSGMWPYVKLLLMVVCWLTPTRILSPRRRQCFLEFLDAYGKWSLVDTFVLVLFMVSFHIRLSSDPLMPSPSGEIGSFAVYVSPGAGFHLFLLATILSLVAGHLAVSFHRRAVVADGFEGVGPHYIRNSPTIHSEDIEETKLPMCKQTEGANTVWSILLTLVLALSLALVVAGGSIESFRFNFGGLAGIVMGDDRHRPYSLISLGNQLPDVSTEPNSLSVRWIQTTFFLFSLAVVIAYHVILLLLWLMPLKRSMQRRLLVIAQTLNAWSGLEVFVLSIIVACFEIQQLVDFIVGDKCDAIVKLIRNLPEGVSQLLPPEVVANPSCVQITTSLQNGCWLLFASALVSTIVGQVMLSYMSRALGCVAGVPPSTAAGLSLSLVASQTPGTQRASVPEMTEAS